MAAIALQHRDKIIESIAAGKRLTSLSAELGITPQAISKVLVNDPEYQGALETGHAARIDKAEAEIESACEQVDVARAGALWRAVSWRASVEAPHRWGAKQQMTVEHVLRVEQRLERDLSALLGRVIEGETVAQEPQITHQEGATDSMGSMSNPSALPDSNTSAKRRSSHLDHLAALVHEDEQHEP